MNTSICSPSSTECQSPSEGDSTLSETQFPLDDLDPRITNIVTDPEDCFEVPRLKSRVTLDTCKLLKDASAVLEKLAVNADDGDESGEEDIPAGTKEATLSVTHARITA